MSAEYPIAASYRLVEGYDIYRSSNVIMALVVVEGEFGKDLRFYRWQKRKDVWKVDLSRFSVKGWDWDRIAATAKELKERHKITK